MKIIKKYQHRAYHFIFYKMLGMRRGRKSNPRRIFYIRYRMSDGTIAWIKFDRSRSQPICSYNIKNNIPTNNDQNLLDLDSDIPLDFVDDHDPNNIMVGPLIRQDGNDQDDDILNGNQDDVILDSIINQEPKILNENQNEENPNGNQNQEQKNLNGNQDQVENHKVRVDNNGSSDRRNENISNRRCESSDEEEEKFEESQFGKKIFFDNVRKAAPKYKMEDDDCDISLLECYD